MSATLTRTATPPTATPTPELELLDVALLGRTLDVLHTIRKDSSDVGPRWGFDQPWEKLIRLMMLLTPQSYGGRMERYLCERFGWQQQPASAGRGDALDGGSYVEIKVSVVTPARGQANFVQLRPHHQVDRYELFAVDTDLQLRRFTLTPQQLTDELALRGTSAHGTAGAVAGNTTREYRITLEVADDDPTWTRWQQRYETAVPWLER